MLTVPLPLTTDTLPQHLADTILPVLAPLWNTPSILGVSAKLDIGHSDRSDRWVLPLALLVDRNDSITTINTLADALALGDPNVMNTLGALQFALGRIYSTFGSIWEQFESLDGDHTIEVVFMPHAIGLRSTYSLDSSEDAVEAYTGYAQELEHDNDLLEDATITAEDSSFYPMAGVLLLPAATSAHAALATLPHRKAMITLWETLAFYDQALPFPFSFAPSTL